MQRPTNSWVALGRAGVSWWRKKNSLLLGYGEGTFCIIYFLVHMTITTLLMLSATQLIILNNMQMWWFSVCVFFKMHSAIVLGWEMSFQSSDWAHCAASVCVCPHAQCLHRCMDDSECPDKNRLPGDDSPAGRTVQGLTLARKHIPLHLTMLSTASFPKPWRPHCWT